MLRVTDADKELVTRLATEAAKSLTDAGKRTEARYAIESVDLILSKLFDADPTGGPLLQVY